MSPYWNFRKILDIHPEWDDRCVAIKVTSVERCQIRGKAGQENLIEAGQLLDTMDRTSNLSKCRGYLDELAYLTMCGHPHRSMEDVRADCCRRWNNQISAYKAADERERAYARELKEGLERTNAQEDITAELGKLKIV